MITHAQVRSLPRIRLKSVNLVKEAYAIWYEKYKYKYTYAEFFKVWQVIVKDYYDCIGEERDGVKLPHLGEFYLGYIPTSLRNKREHFKKIQGYNPEFKPYAKIIKLIYGTNQRKYIMEKSDFWYFKPDRQFKIDYKKYIIDHPERYKVSQEKRRGSATDFNRFFKKLELRKEALKQIQTLKSNLNLY